MIKHFSGEREGAQKSKKPASKTSSTLDTRYVHGLKKLYAFVYGG